MRAEGCLGHDWDYAGAMPRIVNRLICLGSDLLLRLICLGWDLPLPRIGFGLGFGLGLGLGFV